MTIEERFKREQLETLRRLRDVTMQAMAMIESDIMPMKYDPECRRFMRNPGCHMALGDFDIYDRRKAAMDQLLAGASDDEKQAVHYETKPVI